MSRYSSPLAHKHFCRGKPNKFTQEVEVLSVYLNIVFTSVSTQKQDVKTDRKYCLTEAQGVWLESHIENY